MTRPARVLLVLALVLGACADDSGSTTTTLPPTPTTTMPPTTTSGTLPAETEIDLGTAGVQKWEPGTRYAASQFWVPLSFSVEESGAWWARRVADTSVYVEYHQDGGSVFHLDISILAHSPSASVDDVVATIIDTEIDYFTAPQPGDETARVLAAPSPTAVAGFDAKVFDLLVVPDRSGWEDDRGRQLVGHSLFTQAAPSLSVMRIGSDPRSAGPGGALFGIRTGRAARIWVVDVDGSTITIIAATANQDLFDELIPHAEALLAGMQFHP